MGETVAINLIIVFVDDLEKTKALYELFGLSFTKEKHGKGVEHYAANVGSVVFEIYPRASTAAVASLRLGLKVTSVGETIEKLKASSLQNYEIIQPPLNSPWGIRAVVRDSNGYAIELTQNNE